MRPRRGCPATEQDSPPDWELAVPYKRTKLEAERIVLAAARDGLDAVVVNPTTPVGEGDRFPTPTGRMIEGVATGRYRGYVDTADAADDSSAAINPSPDTPQRCPVVQAALGMVVLPGCRLVKRTTRRKCEL